MKALRFSAAKTVAMALAAALCLPSALANGLDQSSGDYWIYDIETMCEGVPVTGTLTYDLIGSEPAQHDDAGSEVDVFRVAGHFEGNSSTINVGTSVTGVFDGWNFVLRGSVAIVMDEMTTFINVTYGIETMVLVTSIEIRETVQYLPPLMSGFDEDSVLVDDRWNETVEVSRMSSTDNGSVVSDKTQVAEELYSFSVDSVDENVETAAGEFRCTVVNMSHESGSEIIWQCADAGRPVRIERYDNESSEPLFTAVLSEYSFKSDSYVSLLLLGGVAIGAAVLVLLAFIVRAVKNSRGAVAPPEETDSVDETGSEEDPGGGSSSNDGYRRD